MVLEAFVGPEGRAWEDTRVGAPEAVRDALRGLKGPKMLPALFHDASQTEAAGCEAVLALLSRKHGCRLPLDSSAAALAAEAAAIALGIRALRLAGRAACLGEREATLEVMGSEEAAASAAGAGAAEPATAAAPWSDPESPGLAACLDGLEAIAAGGTTLLRPGRGPATSAPAPTAAAASSAAPAPAASASLPLVAADIVAVAAADAAVAITPSALDARPRLAELHARATAPRGPMGPYLSRRTAVPGDTAASVLPSVPPPSAAAPAAAPLVCVTGASGFVAGHVIERLLAQGMRVRGTVRPGAGERGGAKAAHLWSLPGASSRLELVEADLLAPGSFDAAVEGCDTVHHCASPFFTEGVSDPEAQLLRPAVEGTLGVLRSAAAARVRRVVVTGSTASVYMTREPADAWYDEDHWSDEALLREGGHHYPLSKLLAERAAWRFVGGEAAAGRHAPELVVLCPTLIVGPVQAPRTTTSTARVLALVDGSSASVPRSTKCMVDVRDVAAAHVAAQLRPAAEGRVLLIGACIAWREAVRAIASGLPPPEDIAAAGQAVALPAGVEDGPVPYPQALFSQEKAVDMLGIVFTPIERTLRDTVTSFLDHKMLPAARD